MSRGKKKNSRCTATAVFVYLRGRIGIVGANCVRPWADSICEFCGIAGCIGRSLGNTAKAVFQVGATALTV